jgi:hypothetical protein
MAKITSPIRFSDHFKIAAHRLTAIGALNPSLNADTALFIDPLLLGSSRHAEMRAGGRRAYEEHFSTIIKLLRGSKEKGDVAWRNAVRMLSFPEIRGTCLGYGAQSVSGSGSGADMTAHLTRTAKEIVDLGVEDPDLFVAMALFEEGFGPDRISDMTTNIIIGQLLSFNQRILPELAVPIGRHSIRLKNGASFEADLPTNPYVKGGAPIILVPADILRDLPIAKDWSDVADSASKNAQLRDRVNNEVADLWKRRTIKDKDKLRRWALSGKQPFEALLDMVRSVTPTPYDLEADPLGELSWKRVAATIADEQPLVLKRPEKGIGGVSAVVEQIIEQFRFLIENRRISEELYHENAPRSEKAAQRLFFAVAYAYCKANNLDITPEADTGNGPVDFKVANGFDGRVVVEIKLSTNTKLIKGYTRQLETYKKAEETHKGYYVVLDVGGMGGKADALIAAKNGAAKNGQPTSPIAFIDARRRASASKL